jgi:hypothetical protein
MSKYKDDFTVLDETTAQVGDIITIRGEIDDFRNGDCAKVTGFDLYRSHGPEPFMHRGHYFRAGIFNIVVYMVAKYSITTGEHIADVQIFPRDTDQFEDRYSKLDKPRIFKKAIAVLRDAGMHAASAILEDEREAALKKARQNRRSVLGQREQRDRVKSFQVTARMFFGQQVVLKLSGGRMFIGSFHQIDVKFDHFEFELTGPHAPKQLRWNDVMEIKLAKPVENIYGQ